MHNRRSLDICVSLRDHQGVDEGALTLSNASKVRLVDHSPSVDISIPDPVQLEVAGFLGVLQAVLETRRKECHRPEDLEKMSSMEVGISTLSSPWNLIHNYIPLLNSKHQFLISFQHEI